VKLNISHALAYVISNEWSRSWDLDSKWRILYTPQDSMIEHERMTASRDHHQGWVGQVQVKNLKMIICLKLVVHLVIMDMWRCASMELFHHDVWGSICESSRSNDDQVRHSGLSGAWRAIIKIKRDAQGKGMTLIGFSFTGLKVVVGRPDYRIDSRTIKRGFRLGNLITSS
jgi:hypothetical protein